MTIFITFLISLLVTTSAFADSFVCTGRMGAFALQVVGENLQITGTDGTSCTLPQDKTFNSDERSYFQVKGFYDDYPAQIKDLDLPELVSPDGYVSYGGNRESPQGGAACAAVFKDKSFRNFYVRKEMSASDPKQFYDTVINVFMPAGSWPTLYLNFCNVQNP